MKKSIPKDVLDEIRRDSFYIKCCISGNTQPQLHHNFIWGGRSLQKTWAIVPISKKIHDIIHGKGEYTPEQRRLYQDRVDWIMLSRCPIDELKYYSKTRDLIRKKEMLVKRFGVFIY